MRNFWIVAAAFALSLPTAALAADCCADKSCCEEGAACCEEQRREESCCDEAERPSHAGKPAPDGHAGHQKKGKAK